MPKSYQICWCSVRLADMQEASYVLPDLQGVSRPLCFHRCYQRYIESEQLRLELRRQAAAERMAEVGSWNAA